MQELWLDLLSAAPGYPSLQTHEIEPLSRRYGMKVWQSYLENKTSGAMRMYWVYGPDRTDITIIGLEPHPEDKKNGAYDEFHCRIRKIKRNMEVKHEQLVYEK